MIAAAIARGTSIVTGVDFLERGYGNIVPRLAAMDLRIERIPAESTPIEGPILVSDTVA